MIRVLFLRLAPWIGVAYPHPQDAPYAFDVAQAAAMLDPVRYEVFFLDGMAERLDLDKIIDKIISIKPEIVALTATSSTQAHAADIFGRIKSILPQVYLIGFGQHAQYSPGTFLNNSLQIEACVYGEPEITLTELIEKMPQTPAEKREVRGVHYWDGGLQRSSERPLAVNLDEWPMPRYEIFKGHDYRIVSINFNTFRNIMPGWILASRGCPYECTTCSPAIRRSYGTTLRKHSPKRVADTFRFLADELGVNTIYFGDDTFSLDTEWTQAVCDELIRQNNSIQWGMSTRADMLSSGLIRKMKAAGLRAVTIGVESASKRILKDINKNISLEQIEWAISEFERNKISVNVTAIFGHVDETIEELKQTISFLKKTKAIFIQLHYLSPYPGTKVAQIFKERLGTIGGISHFNIAPMNVSRIPDKILSGSIQRFYLGYYLSGSFIKKYFKYRLRYTVSNLIKELKLVKNSLAYFLLNAKNKTIKTARRQKAFIPRQSISIAWKEVLRSILNLAFKPGCGRDVARWEEKFAASVKVPYAISFVSERAGTYFVLKLLKEMNEWKDPEIICPSYTFFSVPWAARLAGWQVRLADVLEEDLNLDPESLKGQVNDKTKAVIVTHLNGKPARMPEIMKIAADNKLRVLEDCAHATGVEKDGRPVGSWDIGCFSFGDGKNLGTFGGGIITTSDHKLADVIKKIIRGFPEQRRVGIAKKIFDTLLLKTLTTGIFYPLFLYPLLRWFGYLSVDNRKKDFLSFARNTTEKELAFRFSDLQARVGLSQLDGLNKRNELRRANSRAFRKNVSQKTLKKMLPWDGEEPHTMLHDAVVLIRGMGIVKESLKSGIDLRLDYCGNCRNFPGMEDFLGEDRVGRSLDGKVFFIPNHLRMTPDLSKRVALTLDNLLLES
ncbi:MAG: aminotransferase class I/II-fold pyridoxal phosphate-dependent enzyme [Candidatus Omnitrophota bacterium]|nr:aminotransferase class I/II-fold pyridoxal phosphate-dependent enzyme [Candidatus Omnitrophota bacterium]